MEGAKGIYFKPPARQHCQSARQRRVPARHHHTSVRCSVDDLPERLIRISSISSGSSETLLHLLCRCRRRTRGLCAQHTRRARAPQLRMAVHVARGLRSQQTLEAVQQAGCDGSPYEGGQQAVLQRRGVRQPRQLLVHLRQLAQALLAPLMTSATSPILMDTRQAEAVCDRRTLTVHDKVQHTGWCGTHPRPAAAHGTAP